MATPATAPRTAVAAAPADKLYKGRRYCGACGNPDCVNVSATPFWLRCPASAGFGVSPVEVSL